VQFTQKEMLALLKKSQRVGWTKRLMGALRKEGFLPPLRRQTQKGTNKPLYVWDEEDIDQIVDVYDWWSYCGGDRATLALALWLQGYEIPLDLLRRLYTRTIDAYLQQLTRGKTDPDDILDEVSKIVVVWARKLRYDPRLVAQRKKLSVEQMELVTETVLGALAVSDQEPTVETFRSFILAAGESLDPSTDYVEDFWEFIATPRRVAATLQDILSLPNLQKIVQTATPEQWEQAREDYLSFCQLCSEFWELATSAGTPLLPEVLFTNWKLRGACWLMVPFLSARCRGYGQWIDMAFAKIHEGLADPSIQAQVFSKERAGRTIEAEVDDIEEPELSIPG
jgi:hypothetical protein